MKKTIKSLRTMLLAFLLVPIMAFCAACGDKNKNNNNNNNNDDVAPPPDTRTTLTSDHIELRPSPIDFTYNGQEQKPTEIIVRLLPGADPISNTNYTVSYSNDTVGSATSNTVVTVTVTAVETSTVIKGSATKNYTIKKLTSQSPTPLETSHIRLSQYEFTYNGLEQKPFVEVITNTTTYTPVPESEYSVSYSGNVKGSATADTEITVTVTANASSTYISGSASTTYRILKPTEQIVKKNLSDSGIVTFNNEKYNAYTGNAITPSVTVNVIDAVKDTDYTVTYSPQDTTGSAGTYTAVQVKVKATSGSKYLTGEANYTYYIVDKVDLTSSGVNVELSDIENITNYPFDVDDDTSTPIYEYKPQTTQNYLRTLSIRVGGVDVPETAYTVTYKNVETGDVYTAEQLSDLRLLEGDSALISVSIEVAENNIFLKDSFDEYANEYYVVYYANVRSFHQLREAAEAGKSIKLESNIAYNDIKKGDSGSYSLTDSVNFMPRSDRTETKAILNLNGKKLEKVLNVCNETTDKELYLSVIGGNTGTNAKVDVSEAYSKNHNSLLFYAIRVQHTNPVYLSIQNVNFTGHAAALHYNGQFSGLNLEAKNCEFRAVGDSPESLGAGAYVAGDINAKFDNCKFIADSAYFTKGGSQTFNNCTLQATGIKKPHVVYDGMFEATGSAIIVESNNNYGHNANNQNTIEINITGSEASIYSSKNKLIEIYDDETEYTNNESKTVSINCENALIDFDDEDQVLMEITGNTQVKVNGTLVDFTPPAPVIPPIELTDGTDGNVILSKTYYKYGEEINLEFTVTDDEGNVVSVEKDIDYTIDFDSNNIGVEGAYKEEGARIIAIEGGKLSGSARVTFYVIDQVAFNEATVTVSNLENLTSYPMTVNGQEMLVHEYNSNVSDYKVNVNVSASILTNIPNANEENYEVRYYTYSSTGELIPLEDVSLNEGETIRIVVQITVKENSLFLKAAEVEEDETGDQDIETQSQQNDELTYLVTEYAVVNYVEVSYYRELRTAGLTGKSAKLKGNISWNGDNTDANGDAYADPYGPETVWYVPSANSTSEKYLTILNLNGYELQKVLNIQNSTTDKVLNLAIINGRGEGKTFGRDTGLIDAEGLYYSKGEVEDYSYAILISFATGEINISMNDIKVNGISAALYYNGKYEGLEIYANNCMFVGEAAGAYMAGRVDMAYFDACDFYGASAYVIKAGYHEFHDCTFTATADEASDPEPDNNGFNPTGSAIDIESNKAYKGYEIVVHLYGCDLTSDCNSAITVYDDGHTYDEDNIKTIYVYRHDSTFNIPTDDTTNNHYYYDVYYGKNNKMGEHDDDYDNTQNETISGNTEVYVDGTKVVGEFVYPDDDGTLPDIDDGGDGDLTGGENSSNGDNSGEGGSGDNTNPDDNTGDNGGDSNSDED